MNISDTYLKIVVDAYKARRELEKRAYKIFNSIAYVLDGQIKKNFHNNEIYIINNLVNAIHHNKLAKYSDELKSEYKINLLLTLFE